MQNEFEKIIRQKMEQLKFAPDDAVWEKVEARIVKRKKRWTLFMLFVVGTLLIGGGFSYYLLTNTIPGTNGNLQQQNTIAMADENTNVTEAKENKESSPNDNAKIIAGHKAGKIDSIGDGDVSLQKPVVNEIIDEHKSSKEASAEEVVRSNKITFRSVAAGKKQIEKAILMSIDTAINNDKNLITREPVFASIVRGNTSAHSAELSKQNQTTNVSYQGISLPVIKDSSKNEQNTASVKKLNFRSKVNWGVSFDLGFSNNTDGFLAMASDRKSAADFYASPSPSQSAGNNFGNYYYKPHHTKAFSYGAGVFANKSLTKRFSINAGLNVHAYGTKTRVGQRIDTTGNVLDSAVNFRSDIGAYYRPGNISSPRNSYVLLELPVQLQWQLNKNELRPIDLAFGITPGYMVTSQALHYNTSRFMLYEEKQQLNRFQLFATAAIMPTIYQKDGHRLQIGPYLKYGLINLTKPLFNTEEYLLFYGIKTTFTIKRTSQTK